MKKAFRFMRSLYLSLTLILLTSFSSYAQTSKTPPNILFIIADDLATRISCYGDTAAITPNIDRLAAEGMCFDRAYVQGTVCTPSRTSFLLGLNNRHARRNHFRDNPQTITLGRWFRQHNYQTFSVGKIAHGEDFIDPNAWEIRAQPAVQGGPPTRLTALLEDIGETQRVAIRYGVAPTPQTTRDWGVATRAIQFFQTERDLSRPFFAAIGFFKPHQPSEYTQKHFDGLNPDNFTIQYTPPNATPVAPGHLHAEPGIQLSEPSQRLGQRAYYAAVSFMDEQLGRVVQHLRLNNLLDNTLIVFTSDHGYHLGWRGQWAKHDLSEEVMRVPLIVRYPPLIQPATRTSGIVELIDLFPTMTHFANLPTPKSLDGKSFLPQLLNPAAPGKTAAFCDDGPRGRTIRTQDWRFTQRRTGEHELYHLPSDPSQYFNVIDKPANTATVNRLEKLLFDELGPLSPPNNRAK